MTAWNTVSGTPSQAPFELSFGYPDETVFAAAVEKLVADRVASGVAAQDPTLWGPAAESEAGKRLAWVALPESSRDLVTEVSTLEVEFRQRGITKVVLCGMGGSSLAPEVICGAAGVELHVLDSSDPDFVRTALEDRLAETVVVVSSKSGGTVETDSQRRAFEKAFTDAGIEPAERIVVVTDPGSPLEESPRGPGTGPSWPIPGSAAATRHSPRSAWSPAAWPGPTSPVCSTRLPRSDRPWRRTRSTTPDSAWAPF